MTKKDCEKIETDFGIYTKGELRFFVKELEAYERFSKKLVKNKQKDITEQQMRALVHHIALKARNNYNLIFE